MSGNVQIVGNCAEIPDGQGVVMKDTNVLAFDFGASGGRAMRGSFDGERIRLQELHRFPNDPVTVNGTMYWDVLRLFHEIKQGLLKAKHTAGFASIGIDTWGVDFGLLDERGYLLENPVHYRDGRTAGILEWAFDFLPRDTVYRITGSQTMEINTLFQLLSLVHHRPELLERASTLLLMPDLFNYMLTGERKTEYSIASTTQLLDARRRVWSRNVIESFGISGRIFTEIIPTGTRVGALSASIQEELGLPPVEVIAVAGHDTQDAMAAVPAREKDFIFLSCGTWSLLGTELEQPLINAQTQELNVTNEGGFGNRAAFLKNIIGLWLLQESRRQWQREGREYSYTELTALAQQAEPFGSLIDPDAPEFVPAGDIPERIREYCRRTNQKAPQTDGEICRCILESLAMKYRFALEQIQACTQKDYRTIYMVGGGTKNALLCQMTADACGMKVHAGPVEATVYGNVALQLIALGALPDLKTARRVIAASEEIVEYVPEPLSAPLWREKYEEWRKLVC